MTNIITLEIPEESLSEFEGEHAFKITLSDTLLAESEYEFQINLYSVDFLPNLFEEETTKQPQETSEDSIIVKAYFERISQYGIAEFRFNVPMNTE
mgnify:CR=1 FL=1